MINLAFLVIGVLVGFILATVWYAVAVYRPMKEQIEKLNKKTKEGMKLAKDILEDFKEAVSYMKVIEDQLNDTKNEYQKDGKGNIVSPIQRIRDGS